MKYNIPADKIAKLEALINRANKKGGRITYTKGQEVVCDGLLTLYVNKVNQHSFDVVPIKVKCYEVEVDGCYKINDWEFLGTVEFTENGNIIRLADSSFEGKVPERYLHTPKICEHCGTIRNRKDTYLIYNSKTDEYKQVGSTCLLDYTQGLDANICASIMSCLDKVVELTDYTYDYDTFSGYGFSAGVDANKVKAYATSLVKKFGYNKLGMDHPTVMDLEDVLFWHQDERLEDIKPDESLLEEITNYAETITEQYGYMANAKLAWLKKYVEVRDFGLIASFISIYLREQDKLAQAKKNPSKHVGNIGDRINIKIASVKVLFSNCYQYSWDYYETTYTYEIKDADGNIYLWSTNKELDVGYNIIATIKSHDEYKGVKQTVITRGKVVQ